MTLYEKLAADPERMKYFQRERLETEVTESICRLMADQKVSRAELARRLGKSAPYVTKLLRSGNNLTVNTISDIFHALNRTARLIDRPLSAKSPRLLIAEVPTDFRVSNSDTAYRLNEGGKTPYRFVQSENSSSTIQAQPINLHVKQSSRPVKLREAS